MVSLRLVITGLGQESDVFVGLNAFRNAVGLYAMPEREHAANQCVVRRVGVQPANEGLIYLLVVGW